MDQGYGKEMSRGFVIVKKMIVIMMAVSLSFLFTIIPVRADGNTIDTGATGSINLRINDDEWYVEGTSFRLYQVATISSDLKFTNTGNFRNADIDLKPAALTGELAATASKWMDASSSLIKYVKKHNIREDAVKQMHNRSCIFDGLVPGLYLIQGDTGREGNRTVTYQPVLICVPQRSDASEPWNYNISAAVKSADPTYSYPSETPTATPETSPQPSGTPVPGSYEETKKSSPKSSSTDQSADTEDTFRAELYAGVLIAMVVVIGIVLYIRHKERKD